MIEGQIYDVLNQAYVGDGVLGGHLPSPEVADSPDGRAKVLNVPSIVRILVFDRRTLVVVRSVYSNPDGSWQVSDINEYRVYIVLGVLNSGTHNAAIQDWVRPHVPEP